VYGRCFSDVINQCMEGASVNDEAVYKRVINNNLISHLSNLVSSH